MRAIFTVLIHHIIIKVLQVILINPKYEIEVERCEKDNHGRLIFLDTKFLHVSLGEMM